MVKKSRRLIRNRDNDLLLPYGNENFVFGYVDEVNGEGAEEIAGFTPTRHELIQLVKHWYGQILDINWFYFISGQTGSSEIRLGPFAWRRIYRAESAIGEEAISKAIKEVRDEFKAGADARLWDIFENGDSKQWDAVQDEIQREIEELYETKALNRLEQLAKEFPGDFVALVLSADGGDKRRVALISPTTSELNAVIQASDEFEIETDKSRLRALMAEQPFRIRGFVRITRHNGELLVEYPDSLPGTVGRGLLESVTGQITKLFHAETRRESQDV